MLVLFIVTISHLAVLTPAAEEITHECSYVDGKPCFKQLFSSELATQRLVES